MSANPDRQRELAVRTVLITGATSGLGLAMARALADAGARVAVTGRSGARAPARWPPGAPIVATEFAG